MLLLAALAVTGFAQPRADLAQVQAVYMLPMSYGLEQYLANRITGLGFLRVVTDPAKADAVFTDKLGKGFEQELTRLYPPPKPEGKEEEAETKAETKDDSGQTKREQASFGASGGFSRGKGNLFLVDRRTHTVIWSIYDKPKNATSAVLDDTAERITRQLLKDFKGK